jgi:hypothetical protein
MLSRRAFALLLSTAVCAFALMFAVPIPGTVMTGNAPRLQNIDTGQNADATMAALHQQANAALARLQAAAKRDR